MALHFVFKRSLRWVWEMQRAEVPGPSRLMGARLHIEVAEPAGECSRLVHFFGDLRSCTSLCANSLCIGHLWNFVTRWLVSSLRCSNVDLCPHFHHSLIDVIGVFLRIISPLASLADVAAAEVRALLAQVSLVADLLLGIRLGGWLARIDTVFVHVSHAILVLRIDIDGRRVTAHLAPFCSSNVRGSGIVIQVS